MVRGGRAEALVSRSDVSFRLDKKTGNFKVAIGSRPMQWSALTEEKQKNQLVQTEFRFTKTIIIREGNYSLSFASKSAWHCSKKRQISRWPLEAE
jgi:hypothetical protein